MNEEQLIKTHNNILNYFLNYKNEHTKFTFSTRVKNTKNRLEKGYWFLGSDYIFVPLYKVFDVNNHTQTIGFVVVDDGQYIEIVFKEVKEIGEAELKFYEDLITYLQSKNYLLEDKKADKKYFFRFIENDWKKNLKFYINNFREKTLELLKHYNLSEKYIIDDKTFNKNIHRINAYRDMLDKKEKINLEMDNNMTIKNIILYGSPGVGKTHNTKKLISLVESGISEKEIFEIIKNNEQNDGVDIANIEERIKFITFHQSFGYEDFIEGFRPNEDGDIELQDGIFKTICTDANNDRDNNYYLIIDEINRGNISKIFGELITLIEEDKRDTLEVTLPYSKKPFKIPSNLYIIGTMNSTDKSIALIDIALRRRFTFLKMEPKSELVKKNNKAKTIMENLNKKLIEMKMEDYVLGHSYFMKIENDDDLEFVLEYKVKPLLEEYFYGDKNGYDEIMKVIDNI